MKTAIIGSRDFQKNEYMVECLDGHPVPISKIISGGAKGADKLSERFAKERNLLLIIFFRNMENMIC